MKLRKLLKEVRKIHHFYYIKEIIYPTYDGKQWDVRAWNCILSAKKRDFRIKRCEDFASALAIVKEHRWREIKGNIRDLRKKYNRPSKAKT